MITIRDVRSEDAADLVSLIAELGYPVDQHELWSRIEKMPAEFYRTLVAVAENKVVGFVGLLTLPVYEHSRPIGWILALCVASDQRGNGVGKALMTAAEEHYRNQGVTDIRLHSGLQRDDAHGFYEATGFEKSGYRFRKKLA